MARGLLRSTFIVSAAVSLGYYLKEEKNREKLKGYYNRLLSKVKNETKEDYEPYFAEKVGNPDPEDNQDHAMVSEGAQYSVKYYNKNSQE